MEPNWTDYISAFSAGVTAIAAIFIPIVINVRSKKQQDNMKKLAIERQTLKEMNEFNLRAGDLYKKILEEMKVLGEDPGKIPYKSVSSNFSLDILVVELLNQVEYIIEGVNKSVFKKSLVVDMLGSYLKTLRVAFNDYIEGRRKQADNRDLWIVIDEFLKENKENIG